MPIVGSEGTRGICAMELPAAANGTRIQKVYQLTDDSGNRPDHHWMRVLQQLRDRSACSVLIASAGVDMAQGANSTAETTAEATAETTAEATAEVTAPLGAVDVVLPLVTDCDISGQDRQLPPRSRSKLASATKITWLKSR